jgi:hypothetical protein
MDHLCLFIKPGGRRFILFKFKIGNFIFPVVFVQGFKGDVQVVMLPLGTGIQIDGIGDNFTGFGRRNYHLNGRFAFGPGFDVFHHKTADIQGIGHGSGKTFV